jgi:hypothetical protein
MQERQPRWRSISATHTLTHLLQYSLITLAAAIVPAAVAGWIAAGRVLRPVHRITEAARTASEGNLTARVSSRSLRGLMRDASSPGRARSLGELIFSEHETGPGPARGVREGGLRMLRRLASAREIEDFRRAGLEPVLGPTIGVPEDRKASSRTAARRRMGRRPEPGRGPRCDPRADADRGQHGRRPRRGPRLGRRRLAAQAFRVRRARRPGPVPRTAGHPAAVSHAGARRPEARPGSDLRLPPRRRPVTACAP